MSTHRIYGGVTFECDLCEAELETGESEFVDALREKKAHGWTSRKDENDEWIDVCDACVEKERMR